MAKKVVAKEPKKKVKSTSEKIGRNSDGTFAEGSSNKNGTEEGYLKLNSNGNSISWKFKYDKEIKIPALKVKE